MEVSGQIHAPDAFTPKERAPGTHCIGVWVGPRAGQDVVAERRKSQPLPVTEPRSSSP
jgi:hypothetical protein